MVVCRDGFVVGNAGIFYLQSLGLVLVLAAERASEFRPIPLGASGCQPEGTGLNACEWKKKRDDEEQASACHRLVQSRS